MKKLVLILILAVVLSVSAFAEHPDGWGLGLGFQYGGPWNSDHGDAGSSVSLFLKAPMLPIYWGISLSNLSDWKLSDPSFFGIGITGDYYLLDRALVESINLNWFLGIGGYFDFARSASDFLDMSSTFIGLGARVPIGLYWMPLDFLEVFIDVAPSVGLEFVRVKVGSYSDSNLELGGRWQVDLGVRFWF